MADDPSPLPMESLNRVQLLAAMGITALILWVVAQIWLWLDDVELVRSHMSLSALGMGLALGAGITLASEVLYRSFKPYRQSADVYLTLVLVPLRWPDLLWLGLLPGLSEELLFRGVMLPAIGLNGYGLFISSLCFGAMHFFGTRHVTYVLWASAVGALLGGSVLLTQNLAVAIIAHVFTNMASSWLWKRRQLRETH